MRRVALAVAVVLVLAGCGSGSGKDPASTTTSTAPSTSTTLAVGRDTPTAGACADVPAGTVVVTVTLATDLVPQPRCSKAHGDQHLKIVNQTDRVIVVDFGGLSPIVLPGRSLTTALTFGTIWANGVHDVQGTFQQSGEKVGLGEIWVVPGAST